MGLDIRTLLDRADRIVNSCASVVAAPDNPGARLGAIMGECANAGRNKLTIVADPKVASLGLWVEQLIAESTGKEGKGIVPVAGEPLGDPAVYGDDRLFVSISVGAPDAATAAKLKALEASGHPVIYRTLNDLSDLGEEFFLWEFATAFAGHVTGINPFDQPNVQESKDATKELLDTFAKEGALKEQAVVATDGTLTVYAHAGSANGKSVRDVLKEHFAAVKSGDYVALLDYIEETEEVESTIQQIRTHVRDRKKVATTTGYGPRFLHSTGQLHKGGSDEGVFVQVTAPDNVDFPIPGQPYSWSVLKSAQALGDFRSLATRGRRALRVDLGKDVPAGLRQLRDIIKDVV
jgi:hypothetical protein